MNPNKDWDVEKHKQEHECDEHWDLRKRFLLTHKGKFPEDELVCLAQVFTNVELLGCRYPKETMDLIAELSEEVAGDYRESKKTKLQRTFVKASDAASSKAKGLRPSDHVQISDKEPNSSNMPPPEPEQEDDDDDERPSKKMKLDNEESRIPPPFGSLVLFDYPDDAPQSILTRAVAARGGSLDFKFDKNNSGISKCIIFVNSKRLGEGSGQNQKLAKKEASIAGLEELRKYYYTIKVKKSLNPGKESSVSSTEMRSGEGNSSTQLAEDNIGKKLMKLMGWAGGGLGKSQQGIVEPVTVKRQLSRSGLGLNPENSNLKSLKKKCHEVLRDFTKGDMRTDLVFSSDFTNEERAVVHQVAKQMGLKSQSYGPKTQRTLVISRKIDPKELVRELQAVGGSTDKYELISPTESQWC